MTWIRTTITNRFGTVMRVRGIITVTTPSADVISHSAICKKELVPRFLLPTLWHPLYVHAHVVGRGGKSHAREHAQVHTSLHPQRNARVLCEAAQSAFGRSRSSPPGSIPPPSLGRGVGMPPASTASHSRATPLRLAVVAAASHARPCTAYRAHEHATLRSVALRARGLL